VSRRWITIRPCCACTSIDTTLSSTACDRIDRNERSSRRRSSSERFGSALWNSSMSCCSIAYS